MNKSAFLPYLISIWLFGTFFIYSQTSSAESNGVILCPANQAKNVNPDTHLEITFHSIPGLGAKGRVRVYDMGNNRLVDSLDLSIPPGPTTRTTAP